MEPPAGYRAAVAQALPKARTRATSHSSRSTITGSVITVSRGSRHRLACDPKPRASGALLRTGNAWHADQLHPVVRVGDESDGRVPVPVIVRGGVLGREAVVQTRGGGDRGGRAGRHRHLDVSVPRWCGGYGGRYRHRRSAVRVAPVGDRRRPTSGTATPDAAKIKELERAPGHRESARVTRLGRQTQVRNPDLASPLGTRQVQAVPAAVDRSTTKPCSTMGPSPRAVVTTAAVGAGRSTVSGGSSRR